MTKDRRTVDVRIASALALNGEGKASAISDLIVEIEDTLLPQTIKAFEAERVRLLNPTNPTPDKSKAMLTTLELELERLRAAVPALQQRYRQLTAQEHSVEWNADYALVEKERDQLAAELIALYPTMVKKFVDLFKCIAACDKNVDTINSTAPTGDSRRLKTVELHARGLDYFSATQPSLAKTVCLPHPGATSQLAWPPADHSFAVQAADIVHSAMAARSAAYGPDWHEARKLEDDRKLAEWARRNELMERQQAEAKAEFERSKPR